MLNNYLKSVAEKLNSGKKVYLCPASMETLVVAKMLRKIYNILPTGFCDNDSRKQGRFLNSLPELKIFSFDEVENDTNSHFLIVSPHHGTSIMGNLIFERGIPKDKIINYHTLERKKTCLMFAQDWCVTDDYFFFCCVKDHPCFAQNSLNPSDGVGKFDIMRKAIIDGTQSIPEICVQCYHNKSSYIYKSRKLTSFNFSFKGWCNYKCEYCSAHQPDRKNYNEAFCLEEYLIELEKRNLIDDIFSVLFAVGEPTLNEKRFSLYKYCNEHEFFLDVFSNCSVFDQSLYDTAQTSPVIIRTSFDAGTQATYEKIKGVTCFEKMVQNIRHYNTAPYLVLNPKYLFVPGINDNETDILNFVNLCEDLGVDFVTPVFSFLDNDFYRSTHTQEMFKFLISELTKRNIFTANVDTIFGEKYHEFYEKI